MKDVELHSVATAVLLEALRRAQPPTSQREDSRVVYREFRKRECEIKAETPDQE